jgi:hypothetical protein
MSHLNQIPKIYGVFGYPSFIIGILLISFAQKWARDRAKAARLASRGCCTRCGKDLKGADAFCPNCDWPIQRPDLK